MTKDDEMNLHSWKKNRFAAEYAFQIARGDCGLADQLCSLCAERELDVELTTTLARDSVLHRGLTIQITKDQIVRLMALCGKGAKMTENEERQQKAKVEYDNLMTEVIDKCGELYNILLVELDEDSARAFTQRKDWLESHNPVSAILFFLCKADEIAGVGQDLEVHPDSVALIESDDQILAVLDNLRLYVEFTWYMYAKMLHKLDVVESGTADESFDWKLSVSFERARYSSMCMSGKGNEPLKESPQSQMIGSYVDKERSSSATNSYVQTSTTTEYVPTLQDLTRYEMERKLHIDALRKGLKVVVEAKDDEDYFDKRRFVVLKALERQVESMKAMFNGDKFPIVDDIWHVCVHEKQGVGMEMMKLLSFDHIQNYLPPCVFVSNRPVACPHFTPRARMFPEDEKRTLPKGTIAVEYLALEFGDQDKLSIYVRKLLCKAVETRKGIPSRISIGPIGAMQMSYEYQFGEGGGQVKDENEYVNDEDYINERSTIEAFIQDVLGVKEQYIEGMLGNKPANRSHEERPVKKTPEESRVEWLKNHNKRKDR